MRPLCATNCAPIAAFSNLVSMVTRALGDSIRETSGEAFSGEEVKRKTEDLNKEHRQLDPRTRPRRTGNKVPIQDQENMIIYLMDVKALYQSIQKQMASQAIRETVKLSKLA